MEFIGLEEFEKSIILISKKIHSMAAAKNRAVDVYLRIFIQYAPPSICVRARARERTCATPVETCFFVTSYLDRGRSSSQV